MGLFDKKYCDICGEKIGLLGNRKLEDGNLCKDCAKKLSPWFSDRRRSTVEDINLIDFSNELVENPDILDFDAITGCRMDIDESRTELTREDADGKDVSYVPPRYEYSYDFFLVISVRHPYFDEMRFSLNSSSVYYEPQKLSQRAPMSHAPMDRPSGRPKMISPARVDPEDCAEYRKYRQMGDEICQALEQARSGGKQPAGAAPEENIIMREAAQDIPAAGPWTCPACGGNNQGKFCEYCGSPRP